MQTHSDPCLQHTFELQLKNEETQLSKTPSLTINKRQLKAAVQSSIQLLTSDLASFNQQFNRLDENFHTLTRLTYQLKPQLGGMEVQESSQKKQMRTFRPIVLQAQTNKSFVY